MFRVRVKSTPSPNLSIESIIITLACGGHCDRRLASSARRSPAHIFYVFLFMCNTHLRPHPSFFPPSLSSPPMDAPFHFCCAPSSAFLVSSRIYASLTPSLARSLTSMSRTTFNYAQLGMGNEGRRCIQPATSFFSSPPSASVPQGLGSHGRSREISLRRVECRELFSEAEYCKEVDPLFRPPSASLSD